MASLLEDNFCDFVKERVSDIQNKCEAVNGAEYYCYNSYIQGFRDALRILSGDF